MNGGIMKSVVGHAWRESVCVSLFKCTRARKIGRNVCKGIDMQSGCKKGGW